MRAQMSHAMRSLPPAGAVSCKEHRRVSTFLLLSTAGVCESVCVCVCVCARARVRACVCVCVCGSATQLAGIHVPSSQIPASWGARARDADGTSAHDHAPRHGRTPAPASSLPSPTAPTPDPPPPPRPLRTSRSRTKEELSHQCASAPARPRARCMRFAFCALRSAEARGSREQQRRQGLPVQTMPKRLCAAKTALAGTGPPRPRASGGSKRACAFDPARSDLGLTGSWERCCALHRCCAQHTARVVCRAQLCVRPP